jgi:hypothetical protein
MGVAVTDDPDVITCGPMPGRPGEVLLHLPYVAYLDTQAGPVEVGLDREQLPELLAAVRAALGAPEFPLPIRPDGTHAYVSTYCVHGDHAACRRTCKTCASSCLCPCGHPKPEPYCGYDYHDMSEEERCGIACMCQPHAVGEACNCPEGCPTHNHGGPDVVKGSIGGRATDPEVTDDDRCPVCGCVVGPDCEACERDCRAPVPAPVAGVATSEERSC